MAVSTTPPLHILRGILRTVKHTRNDLIPSSKTASNQAINSTTTQSLSNDSPTNLKHHILEQYRLARLASPEKAQVLRKVAYDFFSLQKDLAERAKLYEMDNGAENVFSPKELSRRAAARAGLQLPKIFNEEDNTK